MHMHMFLAYPRKKGWPILMIIPYYLGAQAEHDRLLGGSRPAEQAAGGCEAGTGRGQCAGGAAMRG